MLSLIKDKLVIAAFIPETSVTSWTIPATEVTCPSIAANLFMLALFPSTAVMLSLIVDKFEIAAFIPATKFILTLFPSTAVMLSLIKDKLVIAAFIPATSVTSWLIPATVTILFFIFATTLMSFMLSAVIPILLGPSKSVFTAWNPGSSSTSSRACLVCSRISAIPSKLPIVTHSPS